MQGKEIIFLSDKVDMHRAAEICNQNGGKLFEPQSARETAALAYGIRYGIRPRVYWIGIHDKTSEGHFTYMDGRQISYTNWAHGEPNNGNGGEDCVEAFGGYNHHKAGKWNDVPCSAKLAFVCERPTW